MKYKALIFDMDGTLLDTVSGVIEACNKAFEFFGYNPKFTREDGKHFIGAGSLEFAKRALVRANVSNLSIEKFGKKFLEMYEIYQKTGTCPFKGMSNLINDLKSNGYLVGICSNKPQHLLNEVTKQMYPDVKFDLVVGQVDGIPCKPNKDMFDIVKQKLNVSSNEALYIGDSEYDYMFAKNSNVDCCIVTYGYGMYDKEFMKETKYHVDNVDELRKLLID